MTRAGYPTSIKLFSGTYFDFEHPERSNFGISDIAHALSRICRFGGHCPRFYSVAQHSVHVSHLVPQSLALEGLMHDAAEAFVGDVVKPLKVLLPDFHEIEMRVEAAVFQKFSVYPHTRDAVKDADAVMLATEQKELFGSVDKWLYVRDKQPLDMRLPVMDPDEAKRWFLERFMEVRHATER